METWIAQYEVETWIAQYGLVALAVALALEVIALPIPGETLMVYVGTLVGRGVFPWWAAVGLATAGSIVGITVAYFLGRVFGLPLLLRYGRVVHLTPERIERTSAWFDRIGYPLIAVGYFIPGVRHLTGYLAGILRVPPPLFAVFAYGGAFLWTATFISLGKWVGEKWAVYHETLTRAAWILAAVVAVLFAVYLLFFVDRRLIKKTVVALRRVFPIGSLPFWRLRLRLLLLFGLATAASLALVGLLEEAMERDLAAFDAAARRLVAAMMEDIGPLGRAAIRLATAPVVLGALFLAGVWAAARLPVGRAVRAYPLLYGGVTVLLAGSLSALWAPFAARGIPAPEIGPYWAAAVGSFSLYALAVRARGIGPYVAAFFAFLAHAGAAVVAVVAAGGLPVAAVAGALLGAVWGFAHLFVWDALIAGRSEGPGPGSRTGPSPHGR
ncbi:MAG: DedA family protein [Hydrogenibacillus schlegelii]|nr:DedA family protein [Hydrogenibacillus schlegelii]